MKHKETFATDFKRFFSRGLAAVLPALLTFAIIAYVFRLVQDYIGKYINVGVLWIVENIWVAVAHPTNAAERDALARQLGQFSQIWSDYLWWVGFLLAVVGIYIFGRFLGSFFGRWLWRLVEGILLRIPILKQVYPSVKQVTDFLLSEKKIEFSRVVAVEYPRRGIWSIGLVTAPGMRTIFGKIGGELLTVFIPSSPTPVTGYTITVRKEEVIDLPITIDEALRFVISGGVILPVSQGFSDAEIEQIRQGNPLPLEQKEIPA